MCSGNIFPTKQGFAVVFWKLNTGNVLHTYKIEIISPQKIQKNNCILSKLSRIKGLEAIHVYLTAKILESLLKELKENDIFQKDFAENCISSDDK